MHYFLEVTWIGFHYYARPLSCTNARIHGYNHKYVPMNAVHMLENHPILLIKRQVHMTKDEWQTLCI